MKICYSYGFQKDYIIEVEDISKAFIPDVGDDVSLIGMKNAPVDVFKVRSRLYNVSLDMLSLNLENEKLKL